MSECCWVYVLGRADGGAPSKVGISQNPDFRFSAIQTACPFKIKKFYEFELPNREIARGLEDSFHKTQRESHLHGEWFDIEPLKAVHIVCIGYRVMLDHTCSDPEIRRAIIQCSGVEWAERRFGFGSIGGETNGAHPQH